jgi:uncharacterized protein (DUF58 family)|uniref:DUF58 domain-containing protein n=1 Tax=candidate division WOR-3 bacterium TaxID=2052148 RepID=A0A7V3RGE1_UNCW3
MKSTIRYLDPEVLARISRLELKARLVVEGFITGLHHSPYKGFSQEFTDYRPYIPGDEIKRIDWKVYARRDRFYIKEYQEETNLRAYILLDKSGSMGYGNRITKLEYAKFLSACLAYLLFKQRDGVGLITFDTGINDFIPPSLKRVNFTRIMETIDKTSSGNETSLSRVLFEVGQKIKRRGLVILISDLFDAPDLVLKSLKSFKARKHEMIVFQTLDPDEISFPFVEGAIFQDMETEDKIVIEPKVIKNIYLKKFNEFVNQYQKGLLGSKIDYQLINTSENFERALLYYLQKRARLF